MAYSLQVKGSVHDVGITTALTLAKGGSREGNWTPVILMGSKLSEALHREINYIYAIPCPTGSR